MILVFSFARSGSTLVLDFLSDLLGFNRVFEPLMQEPEQPFEGRLRRRQARQAGALQAGHAHSLRASEEVKAEIDGPLLTLEPVDTRQGGEFEHVATGLEVGEEAEERLRHEATSLTGFEWMRR